MEQIYNILEGYHPPKIEFINNGAVYVDNGNKYENINFSNASGNISLNNNGTLSQNVYNQQQDIEKAFEQISKDIQSISDETNRELAESNLELLKNYVDSKDSEKAKKPITKLGNLLGNLLGHASSLASIASFMGISFP